MRCERIYLHPFGHLIRVRHKTKQKFMRFITLAAALLSTYAAGQTCMWLAGILQ